MDTNNELELKAKELDEQATEALKRHRSPKKAS